MADTVSIKINLDGAQEVVARLKAVTQSLSEVGKTDSSSGLEKSTTAAEEFEKATKAAGSSGTKAFEDLKNSSAGAASAQEQLLKANLSSAASLEKIAAASQSSTSGFRAALGVLSQVSAVVQSGINTLNFFSENAGKIEQKFQSASRGVKEFFGSISSRAGSITSAFKTENLDLFKSKIGEAVSALRGVPPAATATSASTAAIGPAASTASGGVTALGASLRFALVPILPIIAAIALAFVGLKIVLGVLSSIGSAFQTLIGQGGQQFEFAFAKEFAARAKEVKEGAESLGLLPSQFDILDRALKNNGASAEEWSRAYAQISGVLEDDQEGLEDFVGSLKSADGALLNNQEIATKLVKKLSEYDEASQKSILANLGIEASLKDLKAAADATPESIRRIALEQEKFGLVMTQSRIEISEKYEKALKDFKREGELTFQGISAVLADTFIPVLTDLANYFQGSWPRLVSGFRTYAAQFVSYWYDIRNAALDFFDTLLSLPERASVATNAAAKAFQSLKNLDLAGVGQAKADAAAQTSKISADLEEKSAKRREQSAARVKAILDPIRKPQTLSEQNAADRARDEVTSPRPRKKRFVSDEEESSGGKKPDSEEALANARLGREKALSSLRLAEIKAGNDATVAAAQRLTEQLSVELELRRISEEDYYDGIAQLRSAAAEAQANSSREQLKQATDFLKLAEAERAKLPVNEGSAKSIALDAKVIEAKSAVVAANAQLVQSEALVGQAAQKNANDRLLAEKRILDFKRDVSRATEEFARTQRESVQAAAFEASIVGLSTEAVARLTSERDRANKLRQLDLELEKEIQKVRDGPSGFGADSKIESLREEFQIRKDIAQATQDQVGAIRSASAAQATLTALVQGTKDFVRELGKGLDAERFEAQLIGASTAQLIKLRGEREKILKLQQLDLEFEKEKEKILRGPASEARDKELQILEAQYKIRTDTTVAVQDQITAQRELNSTMSEFESATRSVLEAFVSGWKNGIQKVKELIKKGIFDFLYEQLAKKSVLNIGAQISGTVLGGTGPNALAGPIDPAQSSGNGALQILSVLKGGFDSISGKVAGFAQNVLGLSSETAQFLGSAGAIFAGAAAGFSIGKLISNGYSVSGKSGNTAVGLGTIVGAFIGGPIGAAIGGAIGGAVNRLFGRKLTESGIQGNLTAGGANGKSFQFEKGGVFRSDKPTTGTLDPELESALNAGTRGVLGRVRQFASALGVDAGEALKDLSFAFKLNLKDLKPEEIQQKLADLFKDFAASATSELFKGIDKTTAQAVKDFKGSAEELDTFVSSIITLRGGLKNLNVDFSRFSQLIPQISRAGSEFQKSITSIFAYLADETAKNAFDPSRSFDNFGSFANPASTVFDAWQSLGTQIKSIAAQQYVDASQLGSLASNRYAAEKALIEAIIGASRAAAAQFKADALGYQEEATRLKGGNKALYELFDSRIEALKIELKDAKDPERIRQIAGELSQNQRSSFGLLGDDEKIRLADAFTKQAEETNKEIQARLKQVNEEIIAQRKAEGDTVAAALLSGAEKAAAALEAGGAAAAAKISEAKVTVDVNVTDTRTTVTPRVGSQNTETGQLANTSASSFNGGNA
jgi:hypothetical protein